MEGKFRQYMPVTGDVGIKLKRKTPQYLWRFFLLYPEIIIPAGRF